MTDEQTDRLIDEIRAVRPTSEPSAQDWATSDRGRRVLERVLASAEAPKRSPRERTAEPRGAALWARPRRQYRTALAAAVLVLVVAGLSLGLGLGLAGRDGGTVEAPAVVTKPSAVEHVMQLVFASIAWSGESVGSSTTDVASLLSAAVDLGLITTSELAAGPAAGPMLEGQYAVVLWQAFGHAFPEPAVAASPAPADAAVQGLRRVGVIRDSDGAFDPERPLDSQRERLLLDRMQAALRGEILR